MDQWVWFLAKQEHHDKFFLAQHALTFKASGHNSARGARCSSSRLARGHEFFWWLVAVRALLVDCAISSTITLLLYELAAERCELVLKNGILSMSPKGPRCGNAMAPPKGHDCTSNPEGVTILWATPSRVVPFCFLLLKKPNEDASCVQHGTGPINNDCSLDAKVFLQSICHH